MWTSNYKCISHFVISALILAILKRQSNLTHVLEAEEISDAWKTNHISQWKLISGQERTLEDRRKNKIKELDHTQVGRFDTKGSHFHLSISLFTININICYDGGSAIKKKKKANHLLYYFRTKEQYTHMYIDYA